MRPPVATELSLPAAPSWLVTHQRFATLTTVSRGSTTPASWQARSPSAAYCEFELSPVAGPCTRLSTETFWTTLGFWRGPAPISLGPLATAPPFPPVGIPSANADGSPYDHWPFWHMLSTRNWAHWRILAWYFT